MEILFQMWRVTFASINKEKKKKKKKKRRIFLINGYFELLVI
jgi:hypothetical protein